MNLRRNQTYCVQRDWKTHSCASSKRLCGVDIIPDLKKRKQVCYNITHQVWRLHSFAALLSAKKGGQALGLCKAGRNYGELLRKMI